MYNKFLAKRILSVNFDVIFQINSLVDISKKGKNKFFKAVSESKVLTEKNGRDKDKRRFTRETQHSNSGNSDARKKLEEDPNLCSCWCIMLVKIIKEKQKYIIETLQHDKN